MSRFTIEPANGSHRIRWYTLAALVLLPVLLGSGVLLAVNNTGARLSNVTAAVVNDDAGTTIDGKPVPLGRQLTAGLVKGSKTGSGLSGNYDWVLTDDSDAKSGLSDGRYAAVVTIPKDFSVNATSFSKAATAKQATVSVQTSDTSRVADGVISNAISSTAASVFGGDLTRSYLDNMFVGFNTLHDQLGTAASGAQKLASGSTDLADGLVKLSDGTRASADGAQKLASGVQQYVAGTGSLAGGLSQLASGTAQLPAQVDKLSAGMTGIASGVDGIAQAAKANPDMTLAQLDAYLGTQGSSLQQLADGADQLAAGTKQLAGGMPQLASGVSASASGAQQLASNGKTLSSGATQLAGGLGSLADGTAATASGAQQLAGGTTQIADGLDTAVAQLPTYSSTERTALAKVVANPVAASTTPVDTLVARSGIPLFISLALWIGALAVYLVVQAVSRRALTSRRSSVGLAITSYLPGLVVGVVQGIALAALAQINLQLDAGAWFALAGIAALAGAAFASVVQGLVALFGNAGKFVAAISGGVALAAGLISTAPAVLLDVAGVLPTAPASSAFTAIVTGSGAVGGSITLLVVWGLFGLALSTVAVLRRRTVRVRELGALALS